MISARLKLTLLFGAAAVAIAVAISFVMSATRDSNAYRVTAREALVHAVVAQRILDQNSAEGPVLIEDESTGGFMLRSDIQHQLAAVPNYIIVIGTDSTVYFASAAVGRLSDPDWLTVSRAMYKIMDDGPAGVMSVSGGSMVLVAVAVKDSTSGLARVVAGLVSDPEPLPRDYLVTIFAVVPAIIIVFIGLVWFVNGSLFQRLEQIRLDVEAITDGRSLHRRLSDKEASPELSALIETLNSMISRLEMSFIALRRFTADASHELKTPLAVVRADIERAMHHEVTESERMIALEEALHEGNRMSDLVESLLTLARADERQFELFLEPIDLKELTQEIYETALILGEGAGVTVNLSFTAEVTILGDRARLRQLFLNLVTNAIKYTPAGGKVDIGLGVHPTTVTFAVRDTGIGIATADLPHIFERFWRVDTVRSRASERAGVGLGLAISQWIAQAHSGTLTVSSRLGKGSLFTVTLPLNFTKS